MSEQGYEPVQMFSERPTCPKCGIARGISEKLTMKWCSGEPREGMRAADTCRFGPVEHLHVGCPWDGYEYAMFTASIVPPLTATEIQELRFLLSEMRAERAPDKPNA